MAKKHFTITEIGEDLYLLTPDKGYQMMSKISRRLYSEVQCFKDDLHKYEVVKQ